MTATKEEGFTFIVGVTGHRDITTGDDATLSGLVDGLLTDLCKRLGPVPLAIACGMADGADRLVARRALQLGIPVHAILPMPKDLYLTDFTSSSRDEFERLLAEDGVSVQEIPLPADMSIEGIPAEGPERDKLYVRLGSYLIRRSNLLLALWNGTMDRPVGGTADVVLSYLSGQEDETSAKIDAEFHFVDKCQLPPTANIVAWCKTSRQSDEEHNEAHLSYLAACSQTGSILKLGQTPDILIRRLAALRDHYEAFSDLQKSGKAPPSWGLLESLPAKPPAALAPILASVDAEYQRADGLAIHNQARSDRIFKGFGLMAAAMGLFFLLYAKIVALKTFLLVYLLLFAAGYLMFKIAEKRHWFTKHLVHRVIAETMRVHFYMVLAGVNDRIKVRRLFSLTGIENFSGFSWLHDVVRLGQPLTIEARNISNESLVSVQKGWIEDQSAYFNRKILALSHKHHRLESIKKSLFILSFLGVVALILFKYQLTSIGLAGNLDLKTGLVFLMGLLPLWLGIWEIYQNKMAMRELLWQYRNQAAHFKDAAEQTKGEIGDEHLQGVIADLGERSLFETYLWTIHRYHREFEPPSAG